MNTVKTKKLVDSHKVITLKADKTRKTPEIDNLLMELGNTAKAIPFYAIYPADGGKPILLKDFVTQGEILEALREAGPSKGASEISTAMKSN